MQCVILTAGRGTRMGALTDNTPKPLLKFRDKPIIDWTLENLPREINEVIFVIGYLGNRLKASVKNKNGRKFTFIKQDNLNGTGGALSLCKNILKGKFLALNGDDIYTSGDLSRLIAHNLAVLGFWSQAWRGSSLLINEDGHLAGIEQNPPEKEEKIANTGAYLLDERFFGYPLATIKNGKEFSIPHTLVAMSQDHKIIVQRASFFWKQINTPDDLGDMKLKL